MTSTGPRPCNATEAVLRAKTIVGKGGQYVLGTGDFRPIAAVYGNGTATGTVDLPWTEGDGGMVGSDCCGFAITWCYKLRRHRPGFNKGSWASVTDDINCNSAIEDADHAGELFERIKRPELGALLVYPTFMLRGARFIGHVVIVTGVSRCLEWDEAAPNYGLLDVAECHGPNGHAPGVVASTGAGFTRHAALWPKPEHTTVMLRVKP